MPARCPLAPENEEFEAETRELLHGKRQHRYRIPFTIREQTIVVLHIRHGAMQSLRGDVADVEDDEV